MCPSQYILPLPAELYKNPENQQFGEEAIKSHLRRSLNFSNIATMISKNTNREEYRRRDCRITRIRKELNEKKS